jgi:hypothetical protein
VQIAGTFEFNEISDARQVLGRLDGALLLLSF